MRTDAERIAKYLAKVVASTTGLKVASMLSQMKTGFTSGVNDLVDIEVQVQGICNAAAIPTIQYPFYMNFAREMFARRRRGIDGPGLTAVSQAIKDTYVVRGYVDVTLIKIALDCFTIILT